MAFGRNNTLQRQLEDQYVNIRQHFKHSRRRQDTFEEECVDSLYKLLIFAKDSSDVPDSKGDKSKNDTQSELFSRRSKSASGMAKRTECAATPSKRPATAMSALNYTQSYSFAKDGMNIDKSRRARYLRSKDEKERRKNISQEAVKFEDIAKDKAILEERVLENYTPSKHEAEDNIQKPRPKTAGPNYSSAGRLLIQRPSTQNTLLSVDFLPPHSRSRPPTPHSLSDSPDGPTSPKDSVSRLGKRQATILRQTQTPTPTSVLKDSKLDSVDSKIPISVRKTTVNIKKEDTDSKNISIHIRPDSNMEEYMPLSDGDQKQLEELTAVENVSRPQTRGGTRMSKTHRGEGALSKSITKTQTFLTQYAKRSRLFGFVLKTRSTKMAADERVRSSRSPCITYQELVAIKANIRQHVSKTRSLIQRSANLSSYVDKLAMANVEREHVRERKATSAHNSNKRA